METINFFSIIARKKFEITARSIASAHFLPPLKPMIIISQLSQHIIEPQSPVNKGSL
jgi:hypothetical protein